MYLLFVDVPFYGSHFDPACIFRCPDLELSWYPLSGIENPDSILYHLARTTFCSGPCISFVLLLLATVELKARWSYFSQHGKVVRLVIFVSFVLAVALAYGRFSDMVAWIID